MRGANRFGPVGDGDRTALLLLLNVGPMAVGDRRFIKRLAAIVWGPDGRISAAQRARLGELARRQGVSA